MVVVSKKSGKWRVCVDYTYLNDVFPKNSFTLPRIDQIVDVIVRHRTLCFLDAFSGYHQIPMFPLNADKTTFITLQGLYCHKVKSFRLKNVNTAYKRLITQIFKPLIGHKMEVSIDDIVIKSKTHFEHLIHLEEAFKLMHKYDMKLNPFKCTFEVSVGKFLKFMVT